MLEIVASPILRALLLLRLVPAFLLQWYWTEKRLASNVQTMVRGDGQGIKIDGGEIPYFSSLLEVQNLTPFPIEVDRLFGDVFCGGRIASFVSLERKAIKSLASEQVFIRADMTDAQARYLANTYKTNRVHIVLSGFILSRIRGFSLIGRRIESTNVEIINVRVVAL